MRFQGTGNTAFRPVLLDSFIGLCHNKSEVRGNRKALLSNNVGWGSGKGGFNQSQAPRATALPAEDKTRAPEVGLKSHGFKALQLRGPSMHSKPRCSSGCSVLRGHWSPPGEHWVISQAYPSRCFQPLRAASPHVELCFVTRPCQGSSSPLDNKELFLFTMKAGLALALPFVNYSSRVSSTGAPLTCFFPASDQVQVWGRRRSRGGVVRRNRLNSLLSSLTLTSQVTISSLDNVPSSPGAGSSCGLSWFCMGD